MQIREELVMESSPYQSSVLSFQSMQTTVAGNTPLPTNHLPLLRVKNKDIVFEKTLIETVTSESEISFLILSFYILSGGMLIQGETQVCCTVFQLSLLNLLSASEISLTNTASTDLTWNLSSVAPAYVKVCRKLL